MKEKLLKLLEKKKEQKRGLLEQVDTCSDLVALKGINDELDSLNEEIRSIGELLDVMREEAPFDPEGRTAAVNAGIPGMVATNAAIQKMEAHDPDMDYRKAFMDYVTCGTPIPVQLRADANTLTTDVNAVIPPVLVERIIEKIENVGMILPLVTRTNYAAGVNIPTSSVKPVATWVSEGAGSDRQKKTTGVITFTHHKLRCEISMSMEVGTMALPAFEAAFVRQVSEAMVRAIEEKIISTDTGASSPKGILAETPEAGQALSYVGPAYDLLIAAEAAIPQAYEAGAKWCMTKKTFMAFIGLTDDSGQPIARVNYGIGSAPERTLLGRPVVICDYLDSFSDTLTTGKVFAFIFNFSDYILNTVYDMGITRKQDWETEDYLTKAVMSVDGKVVDKNSLVTVAKAAASAG